MNYITSNLTVRPWPLRWVLGQGSLFPLSQGEAFTLASISYLAILVKYILEKNKKKTVNTHITRKQSVLLRSSPKTLFRKKLWLLCILREIQKKAQGKSQTGFFALAGFIRRIRKRVVRTPGEGLPRHWCRPGRWTNNWCNLIQTSTGVCMSTIFWQGIPCLIEAGY